MPHRPDVVHEWDLFALPSGVILSAVGTFAGDRIRGRLAYVPDPTGLATIAGIRCRKIVYEVWGTVRFTDRRVMSLPGENHYLVHADQIARWYPAIDPDGHPLPVSAAALETAVEAAGATVRLGGSRALGCHTAMSDFDWVVHPPPGGLGAVADAVRRVPGVRLSVPGGMTRMRAKYTHFRHLGEVDLFTLIRDRWRHIEAGGVQMSIDVADPHHPADGWLGPFRQRGRARIVGVLADASPCYRTPKVLTVDADPVVRVVTWLNLYTGALCDGDTVEVTGTWVEHAGERLVFVDTSADAIRVTRRAGAVVPVGVW